MTALMAEMPWDTGAKGESFGVMILYQKIFFCLAMVLAAFAFNKGDALAGSLERPSGEVILEVSGNLVQTNAPGLALLDREQIEAIGLKVLETKTPWTDGVKRFEGVLLCDLLRYLGAEGESIAATALNDYAANIPTSDCRDYDVLLALKMDGAYMTVRNKGPIWVIYPQDHHPELDRPVVHSRWVWQLKSLKVR